MIKRLSPKVLMTTLRFLIGGVSMGVGIDLIIKAHYISLLEKVSNSNEVELTRQAIRARLNINRLINRPLSRLVRNSEFCEGYFLINVAKRGNSEFFKLLIDRTSIDIVDESNNDSLLHIAALAQSAPVVESLIQWGANVNALNNHNDTPLHCAAVISPYEKDIIKKYINTAQLLIQSGANINALNSGHMSPLHLLFFHLIEIFKETNFFKEEIDGLLTKLISWYIYQISTNRLNLNPENHAIISEYLKNAYENYDSFQEASPLLSWLLTKTLNCQSKTELIENILQYLDGANEEQEEALRENIEYVFLQKEILEEFDSNFNALKAKFPLAVLEKLRSIARHEYAQKLKSNIFESFDESAIEQLLDSTTIEIEKNTEHIRMLSTLQDYLMHHCNSTKIQSPFVKKIRKKNQGSRNERMTALATEYRSEKDLTDRFFSNISRTHIENTLSLIKNVKAHLDYIINKKGQNLNSSTFLKDHDILISKDKNEDS